MARSLLERKGIDRNPYWDTAHLCPRWGKRTGVYKTMAPRRYRRCSSCGLTYSTDEVISGEVERLFRMVDDALSLEEEIRNASA